ncbi:hypothetical protein EV421DRAFT_2019376 [Armillaria borealis]|uniref:Zn(2)-C6 fungal-type domain-containing protein n=1 Tax=Armillaria borealis TaxID=47425 RepID=A0AA39JIG5_9AGAR|nr:hypothetical protein EV421DRAFT_2019376 [Armillaria borealis]
MPAELTDSKMKRQKRRRDAEDFYKFNSALAREVEDKRSRGEVSCAERRRLKIKCDKQIPCQSCQRRGCVSLRPNGLPCTGVPLDVSEMASMTEVPDMHGTLAMSDHGISRIFGLAGGLELFRAISSPLHIDEMLPVIYRKLTAPSDDEDYTGPQDLACLFVVLAIGSLVDGGCDSERWGLSNKMESAVRKILPLLCCSSSLLHQAMQQSRQFMAFKHYEEAIVSITSESIFLGEELAVYYQQDAACSVSGYAPFISLILVDVELSLQFRDKP